MIKFTFRLIIILFLFSLNAFSEKNISKEINVLIKKLNGVEKSFNQLSIKKGNSILGERGAPYAIIYEHTGLFEWQLFSECFYDWDIDTLTVIDVDVDYKPNEDYFSTIPAHFYFKSKRPYSSLDYYKNYIIDLYEAAGTNITVLTDEHDSKYGYPGYHYCMSFYSGTTKLVFDSYFLYVDDIACVVYYMTGDLFYGNNLYQIFFDLILHVLDFKSPNSAFEKINSIPLKFNLFQNNPNPFNSETNINYSISIPSKITLDILNLKGEVIKTLINSYHEPGDYNIKYKSEDLASGIYLYRLKNQNDYKSHRMLLIK